MGRGTDGAGTVSKMQFLSLCMRAPDTTLSGVWSRTLCMCKGALREVWQAAVCFNTKQQIFLDFVLSHYVSVGVEELDQEKLTPLLRLKYHDSLSDAVADLGKPEEISYVFTGFQKYLYQQQQVAKYY